MSACPSCGEPVAADALFCEACGAQVSAGVAPGRLDAPDNADDASPISEPTRIKATDVVVAPVVVPCAECGGVVGPDGYCESCGIKAPRERDHFREQPGAGVAAVSDRGIRHHRNEDAMAVSASESRVVLVVCDGVSSSIDSDVASLAGARAARDVLRPGWPAGLGTPDSAEAAAVKVQVAAVAAANTAVIANTSPSSPNPASCTYVSAVLDGSLLRFAVVGDSRAYWLPDSGEGVKLTRDDSMASMLMAGGMPRAEAETAPQAHAITKWLGKDSSDIVPVCGSTVLQEPGWVLACSDGLWNYASEPAALKARIDAVGSSDPMAIALALVAFANESGGQDNITVALARYPREPVVAST